MCIPLLRRPISPGHGASTRHRHRCSRRSPCLEYKSWYTTCPGRREAEMGFKGRLPLTSCVVGGKVHVRIWFQSFDPCPGCTQPFARPPSFTLPSSYSTTSTLSITYSSFFTLFCIVLIERLTFHPAVSFIIAAPWPLSTHERTPVRAFAALYVGHDP